MGRIDVLKRATARIVGGGGGSELTTRTRSKTAKREVRVNRRQRRNPNLTSLKTRGRGGRSKKEGGTFLVSKIGGLCGPWIE